LASLLLASGAMAAEPALPTAPAAATPVVASTESASGSLQELEEIVVQGKRLVERIHDAEDDFFRLYNELNKDDDYDMGCAMLNLDVYNPGSRLLTRVCMPGFFANAVADWSVFKARCKPPLEGFDEFSCLDRNNDERLTWQEASARLELEARLFELDADQNGYLSRDELPAEAMTGPQGYQPPPPNLVLMEGTEAWRKHMTDVTNSDPRLKEMAARLGDMYYELAMLQAQADRFDPDGSRRATRNPGGNPRSR
jgi:hypothetical protein